MASTSKQSPQNPPEPSRDGERKKRIAPVLVSIPSMELHPKFKKPMRLEDLAEQHASSLHGSAKRQELEADMQRFHQIQRETAKSFRASRRMDARVAMEVEEEIEAQKEQGGADDDLVNLLKAVEAQERALEASVATPLHPLTWKKTASEDRIPRICRRSAAAAARGFKNLKELGAPPELLQKLVSTPFLLSAAENTLDAKEIMHMSEEELQECIEAHGTAHNEDYQQLMEGDDEYESEQDTSDGMDESASDDYSDESDVEQEPINYRDLDSHADAAKEAEETIETDEIALLAEAALDWSKDALKMTAEKEEANKAGEGVKPDALRGTLWSVEENTVVVSVLEEKIGEEWYVTKEKGKHYGVTNEVIKRLALQGYERTKNQVDSKVTALGNAMRKTKKK